MAYESYVLVCGGTACMSGGAQEIFDALVARGCPESTARDIFYNNLMRVVKQVCGM